MENTMEVELLNVIKYTTKDNRNRVILRFISLDKNSITTNSKFKGISIIEQYFDGFEVFDKLPQELFGTKCTITTKRVSSFSNPLQQVIKVVKVNDIDLA